MSANAWKGYEQGCKKCGCKTTAYDLQPLKYSGDSDEEEGKPPHIQHLCEMCKKLGYNCRNYRDEGGDSSDEEDYKEEDDQDSDPSDDYYRYHHDSDDDDDYSRMFANMRVSH